MSINGIHGTTPTLPLPSSAGDGGAAAVRGAARTAVEPDSNADPTPTVAVDKPAPLRFPWLSRLSNELGAAAKSPAPFAAPVLGDNVNKQA